MNPSTEFKIKRQAWIEFLSGDDTNSISNQLCWMFWNTAVFRSINESRLLAPKAPGGGVKLTGCVHELFNHGFVCDQVMTIRRLLDDSKDLNDERKGVCTLVTLLKDMSQSHKMFTREAMYIAEELKDKGFWCESRQSVIDSLTRTSPTNRSPADSIDRSVFGRLHSRLVCTGKDVVKYSHKFVAHLATPINRQNANAENLSITYKALWDAQRVIMQTYCFISVQLLGKSQHGGIPVPQYNQFQYSERPLIEPSNLDAVRDAWDLYAKEVDSWEDFGLDELLADK